MAGKDQPKEIKEIMKNAKGDRRSTGVVRASNRTAERKPRHQLRKKGQMVNGDNFDFSQGSSSSFDDAEETSSPLPGAVRVVQGGQLLPLNKDDDEDEDDKWNERSGSIHTLPTAVPQTADLSNEEALQIRTEAEREAAKQFLANIATAEEQTDDDKEGEDKKSNKNRLGMYALVFVVVVVGVAVLSVTLTSKKDTEDQNIRITPPPPVTLAPTVFVNTTLSSDFCDEALELEMDSFVIGTTADATLDDNVAACGEIRRNGIGTWYYMEGVGKRISLSTCNGTSFDTQISVFSGSSCDGGLKCVAGNDQRTNCGRDGSQLIFNSEEGVRYYIMVHGIRSSTGVFTLTAKGMHDNESCDTANRIEDFGSDELDQVTYYGSTVFSKVIPQNLPECGPTSSPGPGSWYVFTAKDTRFIQVRVDDFDANLISVYEGANCESLTCVDTSEGISMFTTTKDADYYVFVHGKAEQVGGFALTITDGGLLRPDDDAANGEPNYTCETAEDLSDGLYMDLFARRTGSTVNGVVATVPSCGNLVLSDSNGVWYSFTGAYRRFLVSTCDTESGFDTRLSVFTGSCSQLRCVGGGDNGCGDHSSVYFGGQFGVEYFVLVHGTDKKVGDFNLTVIEEAIVEEYVPMPGPDDPDAPGPTPLDPCDMAVHVPLDGVAQLGTIQTAQVQDVGLCTGTDLAAPSVYYSVRGTGNTMVASTCNALVQDFAAAGVQVYGGECGNFSCIDDITIVPCGAQMSAIWKSEFNRTYHIQVYASGGGSFSLNVEDTDDNYVCENASPDLEIGSTILGSTLASSLLYDNAYSNAAPKIGAWYQITTDVDAELALSTCSIITSFNSRISIFGDCESNLSLVSTSSSTCGDGSALSWTTTAGKTYFVQVAGNGAKESGNFALTLGPANNFCESAQDIQFNGMLVSGSTRNATIDSGKLSCFDSQVTVDGPSVWYKVTGSGSLLQASTCSAITNFDATVSVFEGQCGALSCIAADSDGCESQSSAKWFAEAGMEYHVLVHGFESGDFTLVVDEVGNSACSNSLSVETDGSVTVLKPTLNSTYFDPCTSKYVESQLSWFDVKGTGNQITVDACNGGSGNQLVSVYGSSCSSLQCEDSTLAASCSVTFDSVFYREYQVVVSEKQGNSVQLSVNSTNYACIDAFGPLRIGESVLGSTEAAPVVAAQSCGNLSSRGSGVWYYFIGDGKTVTAFTCSDQTDFDTQITVFSGNDCGSPNLTCIGARDDNCGLQTWMSIPTVVGVRYNVLISGKGESRGNFVLRLN
ncbi:unnamed protein product [Cylindrotheca closterium]|uniref:Ig-like domain-containing protein n=1 Tax=Cylindrotheca closterium TaxID=2856 RepID=A0AAD2FQL4_9STRA|nr:unnamed protein product [Cylindrotheca closterium]